MVQARRLDLNAQPFGTPARLGFAAGREQQGERLGMR